ncbi:hypothetical protein GWI33_007369 [Rhynchophorus ferrugineus]|uniref:Uncharacterized protein n=1 Tax=Rhynchophorus ferrugineus TaxID=354439 RepID=A0A834IKF2_RHYFE|nr:hypothetical protein GWI33_007369 [Rhynchophorus ferrugineus]
MERRLTRLTRPRPPPLTAPLGAVVGRPGQSPTSRHQSFKATATPEALPMMPERVVAPADDFFVGVCVNVRCDDRIFVDADRNLPIDCCCRSMSGRAVLTDDDQQWRYR